VKEIYVYLYSVPFKTFCFCFHPSNITATFEITLNCAKINTI